MDSSGVPPAAARHWTADNGNGTYSNPLFYEEFEDPDIIRVDGDYYLSGTTMHMNPAVQLMHSKDLVKLVVPQGQRMGEGHHLYKINGK